MTNLSNVIKNGQNLPQKAGPHAINISDLVEIGGPGNEAFTAATIDYAFNYGSGTLTGQTSIAASAYVGASRQPMARDALGNLFLLGKNSSGNLIDTKLSPLATSPTTVVLDSNSGASNTPKLLPLSNGTFAGVYARAAGALMFVIFDAMLNIIAGPTSIGTEYASGNVVYHDAKELSGGGFGVVFQSSAGTAVTLATYSNAGAVVQAATNVQTLASTAAQEFLRLGQLSSGNLVIAFRGTMTVGGTAGTSFVIVSTAGAAVAGPTNLDSTATLGFLELSVLTGFFALAEANGTNLKCASYSNAGALQGSAYSVADTLNSTTYPQVKLTNDGVKFVLAYFGSAANGLNVVTIPTADATSGNAVTGLSSATLSASTFALDAEIVNGLLVALAASSSTSGQYWMAVGLPDAALGISLPYLRTGATAFGTAAGTTGSNWPRVMSGGAGLYTGANPPANYPANQPQGGDWTVIFAYDQQNTAATFIGIQKVENSAVLGVSQTQVSAGSSGTAVTVNGGPGEYPINSVAGSAGTGFNHTSVINQTPTGGQGTLYSNSIALLASVAASASSGSGSGSSGATINGPLVGSILPGASGLPLGGRLGLFGRGMFQVWNVAGTYTWTAPAGVTKVRGRVGGSGASGGCSGSGSLNMGTGGGGGGFAIGEFTVVPLTSYTIVVGAGGAAVTSGSGAAGGSSSLSTFLSATGGTGGAASTASTTTVNGGTGGTGSGGIENFTGGRGGNITASSLAGQCLATGGGSGASPNGSGYSGGDLAPATSASSVFVTTGGGGVGGAALSSSAIPSITTWAGGGGGSSGTPAAQSPALNNSYVRSMSGGPDITGAQVLGASGATGNSGSLSPISAAIRFVSDILVGGGGGGVSNSGATCTAGSGGPGAGGGAACGSGASGVAIAGNGGAFGGGGGAGTNATSGSMGGAGGNCGGGGGGGFSNAGSSGAGGDGLVVIEW